MDSSNSAMASMTTKKPSRKLLKVVRFLFAILLICSLWIYRPYESYDSEQVIPEIRNLAFPLKSVKSSYFLDGGSLGIGIIDAKDSEILLCLPATMGAPGDRYQRLFIGAGHYTSDGATEVTNPHHSKLRLLEILRSAPSINLYRDGVIATMSGRLRDRFKLLYRHQRHGRYPRRLTFRHSSIN